MHFVCSYSLLQCSVCISKKYSNQFFLTSAAISIKHIQKNQSKHKVICYQSFFADCSKLSTHSEDEFEPRKTMYVIDDYDAITDGNPEKLKRLQYYQLELQLWAEKGKVIPSSLNTEQWRKLISVIKKKHREKLLKSFWLIEQETLAKEKKKIENVEFFKNKKNIKDGTEITTNSNIRYGLGFNTIFQILTEVKIKKFYNYKLMQAILYGPRMIIDMGYEEYMAEREISYCSKDILSMWNANRNSFEPFHLIFCNVKRENSRFLSNLCRLFPNITDTNIPFTYTDKSYLDLFKSKKLLYLTPHCSTKLNYYDQNYIYILGAIHTTSNESISIKKAKEDNIRVAKFPYKREHTLRLPQCMVIMNYLKKGATWEYIFNNIRHEKPREN